MLKSINQSLCSSLFIHIMSLMASIFLCLFRLVPPAPPANVNAKEMQHRKVCGNHWGKMQRENIAEINK